MNIPADNPMFALAVLLSFGAVCGQLAKLIRLPSVTGQIVAGVILGPSVLHVFGHDAVVGLQPIVHFALSLIAVDVGTHLHLRRLRNSVQRLGVLLLLEVTITPLLVFLALVFGARQDWTFGILFGALAVSTAPATVMAIVKETRSKGVYVRTLVTAVALNNLGCIAMFEMAHTAVNATLDTSGAITTSSVMLAPLIQLVTAFVIGASVGGALILGSKHVIQVEQLTTVSIIAIFLTTGLADYFGVSNLLACLFLGMTMINLAPEKEEIGHRVFANFEPAILAIFFTLAGLELDFGFLATGWLLVALFVVARFAGKITAGVLAMRLARGTQNVRRYLGFGLIPQAGVAVGLLLDVQNNPLLAEKASLILAVGVAAVAINEIIGPILVRYGLSKSGNMGQDRARLIDFIHEENIVTDFHAETKEDAIRQLTELMISSHGLQINPDDFVADVLERESHMSSCVGNGLSIPYGEVEGTEDIVGVMGISQDGLPFSTPDGLRLRCMVLMAVTSEGRRRRVEIQGVMARAIGFDWSLRHQLYAAHTPAHVYEILHAEEFEDHNYFLEESEAVEALATTSPQ
ncbi:MAG: PTS system fructose-specific IIC component [Candidatus Krumholzibacteriia bacterium]|jgi:PTS system fructose-specific IIC component